MRLAIEERGLSTFFENATIHGEMWLVDCTGLAVRLFQSDEEPRHTGVRYGTNIVRWGIATLASYGKVAIVIAIIAR